jgi:hypothetical protein
MTLGLDLKKVNLLKNLPVVAGWKEVESEVWLSHICGNMRADPRTMALLPTPYFFLSAFLELHVSFIIP